MSSIKHHTYGDRVFPDITQSVLNKGRVRITSVGAPGVSFVIEPPPPSLAQTTIRHRSESKLTRAVHYGGPESVIHELTRSTECSIRQNDKARRRYLDRQARRDQRNRPPMPEVQLPDTTIGRAFAAALFKENTR